MSQTDSFQVVIDALAEHGSIVKGNDNQTMAQCPAHDDHNPSLSVTRAGDRTLMKCHAGCDNQDVLDALRLRAQDLFDSQDQGRYEYRDQYGQLARIVHRAPGKQFRQEVKSKDTMPLYRLEQVSEAVRLGQPIYFVEGEKDVETIEALGRTATTSPQGAQSINKVDLSPLYGTEVIVVVDKDEPGHKWATVLAGKLSHRATVSFVEAVDGKDASDHINAGGRLDTLQQVSVEMPKPKSKPTGQVQRVGRVTWASDIPMEVQKWLVPDMVPLGTLTIFAGKGGEGKSTMALDIAARLSHGQLEGDITAPASTLILSVEDGWGTIMVPRLTAAGADISRVGKFDIDSIVVDTGEAFETKAALPIDISGIRDQVVEHGVKLIILDPANSFMEGDTNKVLDVRRAFEPVSRLAQDTDVAVILIAHFGKGGGSMSDKLSGSHAWRDLARSYWAFATDEDTGKRVFTQDKSNYGKDKGSYEFTLESVPVDVEGTIVEVGAVKNIAATDVSVAEIINRDYTQDEDDVDCKDWLLEFLDREPFEFPRSDILKAGRGEGFSEDMLKRAKRKIGATHDRTKSVPSKTLWQHPDFTQSSPTVHGAPSAPTGQKEGVSPGQSTQSTVSADHGKRPDCAPSGVTRENTEPTPSQSSQGTQRTQENLQSGDQPVRPSPQWGVRPDPVEPTVDLFGNEEVEKITQADQVLDVIRRFGPTSPRDAAAVVPGLKANAAAVVLGRLVDQGLVRKQERGLYDLTENDERKAS